VDLSKWFVEPDDRGSHELPYGLDYITVFGMDFNGDWRSLVNFLSRRAAVGRWVASLRLNAAVPHFGLMAVPGYSGSG